MLDPRRRSHGGPTETFTETGGEKCGTPREGKGGSHRTPGETSTEMRGGDGGPGEGKERGESEEVETDNAREHHTVVGDALPENERRSNGISTEVTLIFRIETTVLQCENYILLGRIHEGNACKYAGKDRNNTCK